jgi:predicted ATPase
MYTDILKRFQPLHLKLENVGPFRSPFELPFTGKGGDPANFFLLASFNGFGKTTVLESIYALVAMLGVYRHNKVRKVLFDSFHPDLVQGGRAQLDVLVVLESGTETRTAVLSVFTGATQPVRILTPSMLEEVGAEIWLPLRFSANDQRSLIYIGDEEFKLLSTTLLTAIDDGVDTDRLYVPGGESVFLPTALYFTADRRILKPLETDRAVAQPGPSYAPAHKFTTDGETWATSLDALLVWYEWLGDRLFEDAKKLINDKLFVEGHKRLIEIDRHTLSAVVEVEEEDGTRHRHSLGRLSHGERSLMHLLVRTAYHRSGSTILLIDELETHLHPKWQYRVMKMLKAWIREWPDLTVIASTHQPEMLEAFAFEWPEDGLVKAGYLIDKKDL